MYAPKSKIELLLISRRRGTQFVTREKKHEAVAATQLGYSFGRFDPGFERDGE